MEMAVDSQHKETCCRDCGLRLMLVMRGREQIAMTYSISEWVSIANFAHGVAILIC